MKNNWNSTTSSSSSSSSFNNDLYECTINHLSPLINDISVVGLIESVSPKRQFTDKKTGVLKDILSFRLRDEEDTIKVTCWGDAVNKQELVIKVGNFVRIENPKVSPRNERYTSGCTSLCELHIDDRRGWISFLSDSTIKLDINIKKPLCSNMILLSTAHENEGRIVSILGIVGKRYEKIEEVTSRSGTLLFKRKLILYGPGCPNFPVTFWNEATSLLDEVREGDLVCLQNIRIGMYKGKVQSSFNSSSSFVVNPIMPDVDELNDWKDENPYRIESLHEKSNNSSFTNPFICYTLQELVDICKNESVIEYFQNTCFVIASLSDIVLLDEVVTYDECSSCKHKIKKDDPCICSAENGTQKAFMIKIELMDNTLTLRTRIFTSTAQELLGYTPSDFSMLSREEKQELKHVLLWHRYKVSFSLSRKRGLLNVIEIENPDYIKLNMQHSNINNNDKNNSTLSLNLLSREE